MIRNQLYYMRRRALVEGEKTQGKEREKEGYYEEIFFEILKDMIVAK